MFEVVLWAAPPVSAIASSGQSFTTGELYRDHMLKDKDHYTHANGLNRQVELEQPRVDAIKRLLEQESHVRFLDAFDAIAYSLFMVNSSTGSWKVPFHFDLRELLTAVF